MMGLAHTSAHASHSVCLRAHANGAHQVIEEGPSQVLLDLPQRCSAQLEGIHSLQGQRKMECEWDDAAVQGTHPNCVRLLAITYCPVSPQQWHCARTSLPQREELGFWVHTILGKDFLYPVAIHIYSCILMCTWICRRSQSLAEHAVAFRIPTTAAASLAALTFPPMAAFQHSPVQVQEHRASLSSIHLTASG